MTFKKAEMAKTLRNGLSMIETNPLSHNWSDFAILSGLTLHQFQKKLLLRYIKIKVNQTTYYKRAVAINISNIVTVRVSTNSLRQCCQ